MAAGLKRFVAIGLLALTACANRAAPEPKTRGAASPQQRHSLATARWEGTWEVNYTLVRLVGASEEKTSFQPGNKIRRIWEVTPGCDDRPCNSEISATNPDDPQAGSVVSTVNYQEGVYRIVQTFPLEVSNACRAAVCTVYTQAIESMNNV